MFPKKSDLLNPNSRVEMPKNLLFNAAGVSIIALAGILAVRSSFVKEEFPNCESRYSRGVLFAYANAAGTPLSTEDIQARVGGLDWGLTTNTTVVKDHAAAKGYALEIEIQKSAERDADSQTRSGMGFVWQPRPLATAASVCLSYDVWTSSDFKPGEGGVLPGIASDLTLEASSQDGAAPPDPARSGIFKVRAQWNRDGHIMLLHGPSVGPTALNQPKTTSPLKPEKWTRIEQEAVLNVPGRANGILRMWVDGKLVVDRKDIAYRTDDTQAFQIVQVALHYARNGNWLAAPGNAKFRLSPLELRLN